MVLDVREVPELLASFPQVVLELECPAPCLDRRLTPLAAPAAALPGPCRTLGRCRARRGRCSAAPVSSRLPARRGARGRGAPRPGWGQAAVSGQLTLP
eukprot:1363600-Pyramimonas_sp.AAC.1